MDNPSDLSTREKIRVQKALTNQEKEDAFSVRRKVFLDEQKVPAEIEHDAHDEHISTIHLVAYEQDTPIGAARLREYAPGVGKAERVAVLPHARGWGIGAFIMGEMEKHAKEHGLHYIKLNAQLHAEPFYTRLGYQRKGNVFIEADIEHVAMEKNLDITSKNKLD